MNQLRTLALSSFLLPAVAAAQQAAPLPLKHAPRPTTAAISAADLMTRLYIFADDSMLGREAGTVGNLKGTAYIEREARRIGLRPAGDSGGYFQNVPLVRRSFDPAGTIVAGNATLVSGTDFVAVAGRGTPRSLDGAQVIYGGVIGDTLQQVSADQANGKLVVVTMRPGATLNARAINQRFGGAAGVAVAALDQLPPQLVSYLRAPSIGMRAGGAPPTPAPMQIYVSVQAAAKLLGTPVAGAKVGATGGTVTHGPTLVEAPAPGRNVVAILPGSDPKLRGEYVAIGAHNDHIGLRGQGALDHDSLRAYNGLRETLTASLPAGSQPTRDRLAALHVNVDSLRRAGPARADSINNGADDDGSGSVSVLEIAEAMAGLQGNTRPKRSILFVWHTGEEKGLLGSRWYTDNPTVPRDSIVAQLNMDMVGRGDAGDLPNGGPGYLQLVGSRRLSTELGDLVEAVNRSEPHPFTFDYQFDANGHPENIYCRSDHYSYARYGIPVTFFTTGLHRDYHQLTDEPQYIDYDHMASVDKLVYDVALRVANLDHRPAVDKPKPDPTGACRQ